MRGNYYYILFVIVALVAGCKENPGPDDSLRDIHFTYQPVGIKTQQDVFVYEASSTIYGEWIYQGESMFYSASLKLDSNGTFQYFDQSCLGKCRSAGTFRRFGPEVHLNSYSRPRTRSMKDTAYLNFRDKVFTDRGGFLYEDKDGSRNFFVHLNKK